MKNVWSLDWIVFNLSKLAAFISGVLPIANSTTPCSEPKTDKSFLICLTSLSKSSTLVSSSILSTLSSVKRDTHLPLVKYKASLPLIHK